MIRKLETTGPERFGGQAHVWCVDGLHHVEWTTDRTGESSTVKVKPCAGSYCEVPCNNYPAVEQTDRHGMLSNILRERMGTTPEAFGVETRACACRFCATE